MPMDVEEIKIIIMSTSYNCAALKHESDSG